MAAVAQPAERMAMRRREHDVLSSREVYGILLTLFRMVSKLVVDNLQVSELLQNLNVDTQTKASDINSEGLLPTMPGRATYEEFRKFEKVLGHAYMAPPSQDGNSSDGSGDASASGGTGDAASTNGIHEGSVEAGVYYLNGYAPHGYVYDYPHGGFESPMAGEWDDYSRFVGVDGVELPSPGVYSDNGGSVFLHATGYSYASQPSYSPYTPGTPVPTIGADGQLYGPQAFQYPNHMFQQPLSPGAQYMASPTPMAGGEVPTSGTGEPTPPGVDGNGGLTNGGPRPGFPAMTLVPSHGPYARGVLPLAIHTPGSQDVRYEGLRAGAPSWADVTKITEGQQRPGIPAGMHSIVSQQLSAPGIPAQQLRPITPLQIHIQPPQHQRAPSALVSPNLGPGALARGYPPLSGVISGPNGPGRSRAIGATGMEARPNGRGGWIGIDKGKQRGRGGGPMSNGNGTLDFLNEQNRGPRTTRIRNQRATPGGVMRHTRGQGASSSGNSEALSALANREQYNRPDFVTSYEHAKFFVIKSYSEDDVHKSIKYNVWASTPVGNKRLEAAYQEALTRTGGDIKNCPVFLFFSVNASGQFCGVAQMTGPVDFAKSVDYWQQDKWNGRFTVTWHIIKDIPNCQFRHIILENNDNKPVTNSRDTQEVKFEQGIGMLNIFKSFASKTSILDDFQFYENRQRALTEKRARQLVQQQREQHRQGGVRTGGNDAEPASIEEDINPPKQEQPIEIIGVDTIVGSKTTELVDADFISTSSGHGSDDSDGSSKVMSELISSYDHQSASAIAKLSINQDKEISPEEGNEGSEAGPVAEVLLEGPEDLSTESKGDQVVRDGVS